MKIICEFDQIVDMYLPAYVSFPSSIKHLYRGSQKCPLNKSNISYNILAGSNIYMSALLFEHLTKIQIQCLKTFWILYLKTVQFSSILFYSIDIRQSIRLVASAYSSIIVSNETVPRAEEQKSQILKLDGFVTNRVPIITLYQVIDVCTVLSNYYQSRL